MRVLEADGLFVFQPNWLFKLFFHDQVNTNLTKSIARTSCIGYFPSMSYLCVYCFRCQEFPSIQLSLLLGIFDVEAFVYIFQREAVEALIQELPKFRLKAVPTDCSECPICLEEFHVGNEVNFVRYM